MSPFLFLPASFLRPSPVQLYSCYDNAPDNLTKFLINPGVKTWETVLPVASRLGDTPSGQQSTWRQKRFMMLTLTMTLTLHRKCVAQSSVASWRLADRTPFSHLNCLTPLSEWLYKNTRSSSYSSTLDANSKYTAMSIRLSVPCFHEVWSFFGNIGMIIEQNTTVLPELIIKACFACS